MNSYSELANTIINETARISNIHASKLKPSPYRLVMIASRNNCNFCKNPEGPIYSHYIDITTSIGFISCENCIVHGKNAVIDWFNTYAYGRVSHLKNKKIKIRRTHINPETNTDIEDGWELKDPFILYIEENEYISCYNQQLDLYRNTLVNTILELN